LAQRAWSLRTIRLRPRLFVARAMRAWRNAVRGPRRESSTSRADRRIAMRTAQLQATRRLRKGKQLQRQASDAFVCAVVWEVWVTFVRYRVLMQEEEEVVTVVYVARQMVPVGDLDADLRGELSKENDDRHRWTYGPVTEQSAIKVLSKRSLGFVTSTADTKRLFWTDTPADPAAARTRFIVFDDMVWEVEMRGEIGDCGGLGDGGSSLMCRLQASGMVLARVHPPPGSDCSDDMRGGGWRLDGDQRDDDDCDNLCEDVSELEAHTRLQESNWELSEHQFDDDYDDGMEYDADA
jgi:hypothetical protein